MRHSALGGLIGLALDSLIRHISTFAQRPALREDPTGDLAMRHLGNQTTATAA